MSVFRTALMVLGSSLLVFTFSSCSAVEPKQDLTYEVDLDELSEFQREILVDGVVTYEEYEKAVYAEYECVKNSSSYVTMGPLETKYGQLLYTAQTTFPEDVSAEEIDSVHADMRQCDTEYLSEVGMQWASQDVPSDKEREGMRAEVMACFAAAGMSVDEKTTDEEFRSISESFMLSLQPANTDEAPDEVSMQKLESYQACTTQNYRFFSFIPE